MPIYTFKLRAMANITVEVEDDNYEEAERLAMRQAELAGTDEWDIDGGYDINDYEWDRNGEEEANDCVAEDPSGDYTCTHHKDGMHIAREYDGSLMCEPWPIVENEDEESNEDEPYTVGCRAGSPDGQWTCTHHKGNMHRACEKHFTVLSNPSTVYHSWPIIRTDGCYESSPGGKHICVHHRNGHHEATGTDPLVTWPIVTETVMVRDTEITYEIVTELLTEEKAAAKKETLW